MKTIDLNKKGAILMAPTVIPLGNIVILLGIIKQLKTSINIMFQKANYLRLPNRLPIKLLEVCINLIVFNERLVPIKVIRSNDK
jgi:hypothetical protein